MDMNPFLMLSGIGIIAVAIAAVAWWKVRSKAGWSFFLAGAAAWIAAILVKYLMDLAITAELESWMAAAGGAAGMLIGISIYIALRTGFLESGISYLAVLKTKLKKMTLDEAIAFGIGFGAFEALVLGVTSTINIAILIFMPEVLATMPADFQAMVVEQLSVSTLIVLPAIAERVAAIFLHVFASVLVIYSVRSGMKRYLGYSIAYKAATDGMVPLLVFTLNPAASLTGAYVIEIPIIILAVIGYLGIRWLSKKKW